MHDHWAEYGPPVHVALAIALGMTKPKAERIEEGEGEGEEPDDLAEFLAGIAPGGWG